MNWLGSGLLLKHCPSPSGLHIPSLLLYSMHTQEVDGLKNLYLDLGCWHLCQEVYTNLWNLHWSKLLNIMIKLKLKKNNCRPQCKPLLWTLKKCVGFDLPCHIYFLKNVVFAVLWQTPYPSGQNAGPTTLVYPQAPQTMNSQPQTRSPVSVSSCSLLWAAAVIF